MLCSRAAKRRFARSRIREQRNTPSYLTSKPGKLWNLPSTAKGASLTNSIFARLLEPDALKGACPCSRWACWSNPFGKIVRASLFHRRTSRVNFLCLEALRVKRVIPTFDFIRDRHLRCKNRGDAEMLRCQRCVCLQVRVDTVVGINKRVRHGA